MPQETVAYSQPLVGSFLGSDVMLTSPTPAGRDPSQGALTRAPNASAASTASQARLMRIGAFIREQREARCLSQEALGALIDRDQKTISNIERGKTNAPLALLEAILDRLGLPLDSLDSVRPDQFTLGQPSSSCGWRSWAASCEATSASAASNASERSPERVGTALSTARSREVLQLKTRRG